jgi:hypothetical protein
VGVQGVSGYGIQRCPVAGIQQCGRPVCGSHSVQAGDVYRRFAGAAGGARGPIGSVPGGGGWHVAGGSRAVQFSDV